MADDVDLVRSRVDILQLIGQKVSLTRSGKYWKGLCPFHDDRNPSFYVSQDLGVYRCWSCGAKGDIFNWVMEQDKVDFSGALKILAQIAGVQLKSRSKNSGLVEQREKSTAAMEAALSFFRSHLADSTGAVQYCQKRGLDQATLEKWEIGFAPEEGTALASHLLKKGFVLSDCQKLFLVDGDTGQGYVDRFRGRLMFPIRDERGVLVAFGGRLLGEGQPKYVNSGDTPLFSKRRVLYGFYQAREVMAKSKRAVLVEGYLDVIACYRAGVTEAVASLGTSLSEEHAQMLRRWAEEVVILYDSDSAGQKAASRAAEMLRDAGLRVKVALLPEGQDPDTLLKSLGAEAVRKAVEEGLSPLDYEVWQIRLALKPEQQEFWEKMIELLARSPNELDIMKHIDQLKTQYPGLRDPEAARQVIRRQIVAKRKQLKSQSSRQGLKATTDLPIPQRLFPELDSAERVLLLAALSEEFRHLVWEALGDSQLFISERSYRLAGAIKEAFPRDPPEGKPALWLSAISLEEDRQSLADLSLINQEILNEVWVQDSLARLYRLKKRRSLQELKPMAHDDATLQEISERLKESQASNRTIRS